MKDNTRYITRVASLFTITAGCLVLAGWFLNIPPLTTLFFGGVSIKFNLAICTLLTGIALYLLNADSPTRYKKNLAIFCAWFVLLIGLLTLSQYIFGWNLGIDELLWKTDPLAVPASSHGRMTMLAAITSSFWGMILLLLRNRKYHQLVQALIFLIFLVSLLVIVHQISGIEFLLQPHSTSPPFITTSIILAAGIFFSFPLSYLKFSFQKKIAGFFLTITLFIGIIFFAINKNREHLLETSDLVANTGKVIFQSEQIRAEVAEMQNGVRGFLLTGNENYLPLFSSSATVLDRHIHQFKTLTINNPLQQASIDTLEKKIIHYIESRKEIISFRRTAGYDIEKIKASVAEGKETTDWVRSLINTIQYDENQVLAIRKAENEQSTQNTSRLITSIGVITVLLMLAALFVIYNNTRLRKKIAEEIMIAEGKLRLTLHTIGDNAWEHDFETGKTYFSETIYDLLGYSNSEMTDKVNLWWGNTHPEDRLMLEENDRKYKEGLISSHTLEYRIYHKDGSLKWILDRGVVLNKDEKGLPLKIVGTHTDITGRKKAEEAILKERDLSDSIINGLPGLFYLFDEKGNLLRWNKNFETVSGYSAAEISKLRLLDFFDADIKQQLRNKIAEAFTKEMADTEAPFFTKNKEKIAYYFTAWRIIFEGKTCFIGVGIDITEQKKAEEELKRTQQDYSSLINTIEGIVWEADAQTFKFSFVSNQAKRLLGYPVEDWVNEPAFWRDHIHPDDRDRAVNYCVQCTLEKKPHEFEYRMIAADGRIIWLRDIVSVIVENGKPVKLRGIMVDVMERKMAEQELMKSTQEIKNLLDNMNDGFIVDDISGKIKFANKNFLEIYGFTDDNINDLFLEDYVAPEYVEMLRDRHKRRLAGEKVPDVFEFEGVRKDGKRIWLEVHVNPIIENGIFTGTQSIIRDITERKKAKEKLLESNERYEFVNKATQDTIWEWDYATKEGKWGEGIINTFGYSEDKLKYGENWVDEYIHPYDREEVRRKIKACIESEIENWQYEYRFRCADGSYKNVFDRGFILFDDKGNPYRMIGAMTDVTERKNLERELAEYLVRQQKLITEATIQAQEKERNELGRELHDNVNQILATVKMYMGMIKADQNFREDVLEKSFENLDKAIAEVRKLSHSLVAPTLGDIGLQVALEELIQDNNQVNGLKISLVYEMQTRKLPEKNQELMLYRITQEQINNIHKYARAKIATIHLKTEEDNIHLSISDDGVGFDPAKKAKGIGLKNISSRVEFYGGRMNINSAPGKGCTIEVNIPLTNQKYIV